MELNNFINDNKIQNFDILKTKLEEHPYNLKFKYDDEYPNLALIYNDVTSNLDEIIVRICNGIIIDKKTLKILCYTFNKCSDNLNLPDNICKDNLYIETSIEGTLIRMFYYEDKWIYSTKKCIDASKAKWLSDKNFIELFKDCILNNDNIKNIDNLENILNKNNCYSFIITHPENKIVTPYTTANAFHISTRDMTSLNEIIEDIKFLRIEKKKINKDYLETFFLQILKDMCISYEGFIFIDENYNRWKILTPIFIKIRKLWGNSNNRFFRYLELRKNSDLLQEYIIYYPNDQYNFIIYENKISEFSKFILNKYTEKHILKLEVNSPYYLRKVLYELHGNYFKDKIRTDYNKIMNLLLGYDAKYLCHIINHYNKDMLNMSNILDKKSEIKEKLYDDTYIDYSSEMMETN